MKSIFVVSTLAAALLLGSPLYAQNQKKNTPKQEQRQNKNTNKEKATQNKNVAKEQNKGGTGERGQDNLRQRGGRIPDEKFRGSFGEGHRFRPSMDIEVGGYGQFEYGGYSFDTAEPWPAGWLVTDDCYIVATDEGYMLINPRLPGVGLSLTINID